MRLSRQRKGGGDHEVQGNKATDLEWRVAVALERLRIPYMFQYALLGGQRRRGGLVVDFLVFTAPLSTPLEVMGGYWHRSGQRREDRLKEAMVRHLGNFAEMVYLWEGELQTLNDAYKAVKRELRV